LVQRTKGRPACGRIRADLGRDPPGSVTVGKLTTLIRGNLRYKTLPTDAAPVPLAGEITALEADLAARSYTIALNHYQQAVDGFTHHKYESSNGDLRTMLEDLVTRLAVDYCGYNREERVNQGGTAVNHLVAGGYLPEQDGGMFLRGLWKLAHTHGSHPGRSGADEARFRMQTFTATARYLLNYFPSRQLP
jgi:hypothetical protein